MSDSRVSEDRPAGMSREEMLSALFAQLVMQQANMAMLLMGKVAHPETGQVVKDIEAARLFIDQLEMLEAKTKGNLTAEEAAFLKQSLMSVRLAFVEAAEAPQPTPGRPAEPAKAAEPGKPETPQAAPAPPPEHHTKFTKKY